MFNIAHIHPMLVHFPLALLPVALISQLIALIKGQGLFQRQCMSSTGVALISIAALASIVAAMFGDMALDKAVDSGVKLASLETHEELGQLSAGLLIFLAGIEVWLYRQMNSNLMVSRGMWVLGLGVLIVLVSTAWFGGQLVYGLGVNVDAVKIH